MITQLLVGLWAVIATVFAFRTGHEESVADALTRIAALSLSGALCLIYLLALPFYSSGLAALLGIGILVLILIGRGDDAFPPRGNSMSDPTITPHGLSLHLLAACAGSVNLLSIMLLGGALSGILTGDFVNSAHDVGNDQWTLIRNPALAILGFGFGVAVWSSGLRRAAARSSDARRVGLLAELVLLLCIPAGLASTRGRPGETISLALLAAAAATMGAQSAVRLRGGVSKTYTTFTFTLVVNDFVDRGPRRNAFVSLSRSLALLGGATVAASLLTLGWWAAATLPSLLLAAALFTLPATSVRKEESRCPDNVTPITRIDPLRLSS